ncbi:DUF2079 domain-containing protein [Hymenobacter humi]|uniref:DUF2079 domain-containing protein n=1 Tax=Hymenobacter humi TaxID=1411620 RepID=A0ABW2U288_9BACT
MALVLVVFGVAFGLLALVNHYLFRTFAYDLGIYNQALWDYAHLRPNVNSVMRYNNLFGDHFTLLQPLYAPLYWVFGSYTLLVVQIGLILVGATAPTACICCAPAAPSPARRWPCWCCF